MLVEPQDHVPIRLFCRHVCLIRQRFPRIDELADPSPHFVLERGKPLGQQSTKCVDARWFQCHPSKGSAVFTLLGRQLQRRLPRVRELGYVRFGPSGRAEEIWCLL